MPIKAEHRHRYPPNWPAIRAAILERAGHRCEFCGVPNHQWICRIGFAGSFVAYQGPYAERASLNDEFHKARAGYWGRVYVVLTIAHLDHTPENCDPANLRALCQRCHLAYDADHHRQSAWRTRRAGKALGDLFPTPNT